MLTQEFTGYPFSSYFPLEQLVSKAVLKILNDSKQIHNGIFLFDPKALYTLDELRKRFGPIVINDGQSLQHCGLRMLPYDPPIGATFSQHKWGRAFDCHFVQHPGTEGSDEVRKDILENQYQDYSRYITCLEVGISWVHFDVRNKDKELGGILVVNP